MAEYVGLDVSLEETSICVVNEHGEILAEGKARSTPEDIARYVKKRGGEVTRVGLESGPLSTWHWHGLRDLGLPVVCVDARSAQGILGQRINKTDRNDARGLARLMVLGPSIYREVKVKAMSSHTIQALVTARAKIVAIRRDVENTARGLLKTFGVVVPRGKKEPFARRVAAAADQAGVSAIVAPLMAVQRAAAEQIKVADGQLRSLARSSARARQLMTVPAVGVVTSLAFLGTVDDPDRFARACQAGAYVGLTPRRYQSGEMDYTGRISKCGDALTRGYLFEAAHILLRRVKRPSVLQAWGRRLAARIGWKKATVAVARKLAVIMMRMLKDGSEFQWQAA